jgi:hypothetical protein
MISHHVYTALALAHKQAQTEAARQAQQARLHRQRAGRHDAGRSLPGWILHRLRHCWSRRPGQRLRSAAKRRPVVLRDGSKVVIRPVRGTDAPLLADGFARLSARSRHGLRT